MHTYASIYLHVVFATWSRRPSLTPSLRPRVHSYLAATARNLGISDVHVGGHDDHVHVLGRFAPVSAPSSIIGQLKHSASQWARHEIAPDFQWQRGFSAFSVSRDRVDAVVRYVRRQEEHHRTATFRDELEKLLRDHGVNLENVHLL